MLIANNLERVFYFNEGGTDIRLADPDSSMSIEAALNFYANTYPILTTAKISGPEIQNDEVQYRFETTIGTKG